MISLDPPLVRPKPVPPTFPLVKADGSSHPLPMRSLVQHHLIRNIRACAARKLPMIRAGIHEGRRAVVVGTGPSLDRRENRRAVKRLAAAGAVVYALKSAASILQRDGVRIDYIVNCDAQPNQVAKMPLLPQAADGGGPVYLLGSACDPGLYDHVLGGGCRVEVFHSATGAQVTDHGSETDWYHDLFPHAWVAMGGMTVANRAVACAYFHGCRQVMVVGCDFGVRDKAHYYATGAAGRMGPGTLWVTDDGKTDGRPWFTQPSLVMSAVSMAKLARAGFVRILGDSLAASLARQPEKLARAARGVA